MADSITSLQEQANLTVFRKCEVRRRTDTGYEADWFDVTDLVTKWPSLQTETDSLKPFVYRRGQASLSFRNESKQFGRETFNNSVFSTFLTRFKTQCRISTGLENSGGSQFPSTNQVFYGVFTDNVIDDDIETHVTVNDVTQVLSEFPSSNIAPSVVGVALTSNQILGTIRDYQDGSGNTVLAPYLSSSIWFLSGTARTYTVATSTDLDGLSALQLIEQLAQAENNVFYLDGNGNLKFTDRVAAVSSTYDFKGPGERNVNIASLDNYNEGIYKVFNKFSLQMLTSSVISTQQSFTVGDGTSSWKYGQREFAFSNKFVSSATAGSVCSDLLTQFTDPKSEIKITTKYITQLQIKDRVTVTYRGEPTGDNSVWGQFLWGHQLWSGYSGGILINGVDYHIIAQRHNMENFTTNFHLREV